MVTKLPTHVIVNEVVVLIVEGSVVQSCVSFSLLL